MVHSIKEMRKLVLVCFAETYTRHKTLGVIKNSGFELFHHPSLCTWFSTEWLQIVSSKKK